MGDSALIEVPYQRGAMVLLDDVDHGARKMMFFGEFNAVRNVPLDDAGGDNRISWRVRVDSFALVFAEEGGVRCLADIMKERADPGDQRIRADGVGGIFSELGHHQRMVVGSRSVELHATEQGMVVISEFQ